MRFPKMKCHFPGKWIAKGFFITAQPQAGFHPTDWQLPSFQKCSNVRPPHSFFSLEESKTGLKKNTEIIPIPLIYNYKTSNLVDHRGRVDHYVLRERKQLKGRTDSATFDIVRMWNNCTGRTQIWNEVWHYSSFLGRTAITGSNTLFFFSKSLVLLNV